jgi:two-component system response regulator NreC
MKKTRVLIADDHVLVRDGLTAIFENQPDIEVVGQATDGMEAIIQVEKLQPDVVLMDVTMPKVSGLEATEEIKRRFPDIMILALTMHESDEYFFKMLNAGAMGYFIKGGSSAELLSAVHTVAQGNVFLYPTMANKLLSDYLQREKVGGNKRDLDGLTKREREILKLIGDDCTNQDIANRLVLSVATVQTHRANIMAKLGIHSRTALMKYALRHGFTTLDS